MDSNQPQPTRSAATPAIGLRNRILKRGLDVTGAMIGLVLFGWLIALAAVASSVDTGGFGIFCQERIGRHGRPFRMFKLRTMRNSPSHSTTVTVTSDPRITRLGRILRRYAIDELPQLVNILFGQMSLVGPRPDVPGFADHLQGADRVILVVRPGLTGPASLKYRDEEELLQRQTDPERYNRETIFPDKVRINRAYVENYRFRDDLLLLLRTLLPFPKSD